MAAFEGAGAEFTFRRTVAEELAKAIIAARVPIVPQIVSGGTAGGGNIVDAMAAMLMQKMVKEAPQDAD